MIKSRFHFQSRTLSRIAENAGKTHRRLMMRFGDTANRLRVIIGSLAVIAAIFCIIEIILYFGYDRNPAESASISRMIRIPQAVFAINILFRIVIGFKPALKRINWLKSTVNILLLISVVVWVVPRPASPWFPAIAKLLYSRAFLFSVLGAYSIFEICYAALHLIGRRTNPALILSTSFLIFILLGSLLLMLPKCTVTPISYCDSLFVSTSAVCITGLTSVDIPSTFTPLGLLILSCLIQIGGLGVITFTSFFAIFFSGSPGIYSQLILKDIVYSKTLNNLIPTLLYILAFTIIVELAGAAAIYLTIPPELGLSTSDRLIFAGFHSLSSFCNAGFSCLPGGMSNRILLDGTQSIYVVTSVLIFAGAIGFPILVNFKDIIVGRIRRLFSFGRQTDNVRRLHVYDLNTKLVLVTTIAILAVGSVAFFCLEYNNTLAGMPLDKKIIQSVFNSLVPRSAGFSSVNPAMFLPVTLLLVVVQMWIGGASQSLAGGVKVNTFAVVLLNLRAIIRGHKAPTAFGRRIATDSVRRANAVVIIAGAAFTLYAVAILLLEPTLSVRSVLFEVTSALFTVGSSLGITDQLSDPSKIILATAMFAGRVGILSLLIGFASNDRDRSAHYPPESVIIS